MKKWTTVVWKEIFCRFRISNQIFGSIYGSRDIERSLDTTLAVFGENLNFMDEYLENGVSSWPAVFCKCFVSISSIILELFNKIVRAVFEKNSKKWWKKHVFVLFGWSKKFLDNPLSTNLPTHRCLTSCKKLEKSLEPFSLTFCDRPTFWV